MNIIYNSYEIYNLESGKNRELEFIGNLNNL